MHVRVYACLCVGMCVCVCSLTGAVGEAHIRFSEGQVESCLEACVSSKCKNYEGYINKNNVSRIFIVVNIQ